MDKTGTYCTTYFPDTACPYPADPPQGSDIGVRDWDGDVIPIGRSLRFGCKNGQRFEADFDREAVEATCSSGGRWAEPDDWGRCVESEDSKWDGN